VVISEEKYRNFDKGDHLQKETAYRFLRLFYLEKSFCNFEVKKQLK
jgi:hypothetical protein